MIQTIQESHLPAERVARMQGSRREQKGSKAFDETQNLASYNFYLFIKNTLRPCRERKAARILEHPKTWGYADENHQKPLHQTKRPYIWFPRDSSDVPIVPTSLFNSTFYWSQSVLI